MDSEDIPTFVLRHYNAFIAEIAARNARAKSRSTSMTPRRAQSDVVAAGIPVEILLQIFHDIPPKSRGSLPLICTAWKDAATVMLYHDIEILTPEAIAQFFSTLKVTGLGTLVASLRIGGRLDSQGLPDWLKTVKSWWSKGPDVSTWDGVFLAIVEYCPNLRALNFDDIQGPSVETIPHPLPRTCLRCVGRLEIKQARPVRAQTSMQSPSSFPGSFSTLMLHQNSHWLLDSIASGRLDLPELTELRVTRRDTVISGQSWPSLPRLRVLYLEDLNFAGPSLKSLVSSARRSLTDITFSQIRIGLEPNGGWPSLPHVENLRLLEVHTSTPDVLVGLIRPCATTVRSLEIHLHNDLNPENISIPWPELPRLQSLVVHSEFKPVLPLIRRVALGLQHFGLVASAPEYSFPLQTTLAAFSSLKLTLASLALLNYAWNQTQVNEEIQHFEALDSFTLSPSPAQLNSKFYLFVPKGVQELRFIGTLTSVYLLSVFRLLAPDREAHYPRLKMIAVEIPDDGNYEVSEGKNTRLLLNRVCATQNIELRVRLLDGPFTEDESKCVVA